MKAAGRIALRTYRISRPSTCQWPECPEMPEHENKSGGPSPSLHSRIRRFRNIRAKEGAPVYQRPSPFLLHGCHKTPLAPPPKSLWINAKAFAHHRYVHEMNLALASATSCSANLGNTRGTKWIATSVELVADFAVIIHSGCPFESSINERDQNRDRLRPLSI